MNLYVLAAQLTLTDHLIELKRPENNKSSVLRRYNSQKRSPVTGLLAQHGKKILQLIFPSPKTSRFWFIGDTFPYE
jgi:hypothetical protein